jgi:hypothetical protein
MRPVNYITSAIMVMVLCGASWGEDATPLTATRYVSEGVPLPDAVSATIPVESLGASRSSFSMTLGQMKKDPM